jgi:hypothetical protein
MFSGFFHWNIWIKVCCLQFTVTGAIVYLKDNFHIQRIQTNKNAQAIPLVFGYIIVVQYYLTVTFGIFT